MNYATKMLDWEDPNIGYQQQRGQHGEGVTVTHNIVRFLPLPDGALEINFGNTVHFCGGSVVHRSDGELLLSAEQREDLAAALRGPNAAQADSSYMATKPYERLFGEQMQRSVPAPELTHDRAVIPGSDGCRTAGMIPESAADPLQTIRARLCWLQQCTDTEMRDGDAAREVAQELVALIDGVKS